MVADWIVIYAVLFVLAAAVAGRVRADNGGLPRSSSACGRGAEIPFPEKKICE
jgi:hypothetical protein